MGKIIWVNFWAEIVEQLWKFEDLWKNNIERQLFWPTEYWNSWKRNWSYTKFNPEIWDIIIHYITSSNGVDKEYNSLKWQIFWISTILEINNVDAWELWNRQFCKLWNFNLLQNWFNLSWLNPVNATYWATVLFEKLKEVAPDFLNYVLELNIESNFSWNFERKNYKASFEDLIILNLNKTQLPNFLDNKKTQIKYIDDVFHMFNKKLHYWFIAYLLIKYIWVESESKAFDNNIAQRFNWDKEKIYLRVRWFLFIKFWTYKKKFNNNRILYNKRNNN